MSAQDGICISRRTIRAARLVAIIVIVGVIAWGAPSMYRYAKIEAM